MIWVALYESAEHYSSIRVKGRSDEGAARVPDVLCVAHNAAPNVSAESSSSGLPSPSRESLLHRVLSALPPGSVSSSRASSVLERTKGDWAQTVEILLEEDVIDSTPETSPCPSCSDLPDERSVVSDLLPAEGGDSPVDIESTSHAYTPRSSLPETEGSPDYTHHYRSNTPISTSTSPSHASSAAGSSGSSAAVSRSGSKTPPRRRHPLPKDETMLERIRKPHRISLTDGTQTLANDTAHLLDQIEIRTSPASPPTLASGSDSDGSGLHKSKHQAKGSRNKPRTRSAVSPSRDADGAKLPTKSLDASMSAHRLTRSHVISA
jgi:hypothetical protein